jgi:hypothetical protein
MLQLGSKLSLVHTGLTTSVGWPQTQCGVYAKQVTAVSNSCATAAAAAADAAWRHSTQPATRPECTITTTSHQDQPAGSRQQAAGSLRQPQAQTQGATHGLHHAQRRTCFLHTGLFTSDTSARHARQASCSTPSRSATRLWVRCRLRRDSRQLSGPTDLMMFSSALSSRSRLRPDRHSASSALCRHGAQLFVENAFGAGLCCCWCWYWCWCWCWDFCCCSNLRLLLCYQSRCWARQPYFSRHPVQVGCVQGRSFFHQLNGGADVAHAYPQWRPYFCRPPATCI